MNISEISALNCINIGIEMSSGDVVEKNMVLYEIYKKKNVWPRSARYIKSETGHMIFYLEGKVQSLFLLGSWDKFSVKLYRLVNHYDHGVHIGRLPVLRVNKILHDAFSVALHWGKGFQNQSIAVLYIYIHYICYRGCIHFSYRISTCTGVV